MIGAVDIGGTKIAAGMVDAGGRILARREQPSGRNLNLQDGLALIVAMLRGCASEVGGTLEGIGVGCTGPVDPLEGTLGTIEFLPGWEGCDLVKELEREFGVRAALENDADAAALGEWAWGSGRGARSFLYVTVSTGIGVGVVLDGRLYRGAGGAHPELGHHVIDPSGPECFCGAHGCWESLAGGLALAEAAHRSSAQEACRAAEQGDETAIEAVRREAKYLGLGFANLVTLFVPDVIALGGGVMQSRHLFMDTVEQTIRENCGLVPHERTRLAPAQLGRETGLAGAAQAWLQGQVRHD